MLIGEILIKRYGLKTEDIKKALDIQKEVGGYIGQVLLQTGLIHETQLISALSEQLKLPIFDKEDNDFPIEGTILSLKDNIDIDFIVKYNFIPVDIDHKSKTLTLITNDPLNNFILDYIVKSLDYDIYLLLTSEHTLKDISQQYIVGATDDIISLHIDETPERLKEMAFEAPVIKYLNNIISRAVELRASDIHIEPSGVVHKIRFRTDGVLHDIDSLKEEFYLALVSRVKLLSSLDIAEKRLPQDGKFSIRVGSTILDIRVSTAPTVEGEDIVMRLLYKERLSFDLRLLGQQEDHFLIIKEMISNSYGIILVTGPTGSGKTTTLYSILTSLNNNEKKMITIEDPVEYQIAGLNQIQVKSDIGLTFASTLRSTLRHDPDIIMVGEIRDSETASIAIQSSLTGHLVLSTLHTNDAPSSLFRLLDMGIEDYLINASVIGIIAQRIIRQNCTDCLADDKLSKDVIKEYKISEIHDKFRNAVQNGINFKRGQGCKKCVGTGYRGRTSIFEVFKYDESLKDIFLKNHSLESITSLLTSRPYFRTLREDGMLKAMNGLTTIEEVLRVV